MNLLVKNVKKFIETNNINGTVLIAFSGGADSMCLLDIVNSIRLETNIKPIAIHLNHNWRADDSLRDEINCKNFCTEKNIEFYSEKLNDDIPKTETAARDARYDFFQKCTHKFDAKFVFTAHTASDNAETILYRIIKGTGIEGLEGIKPKRGIFYRPLLNIQRGEIERYCEENNLQPNIDQSNFDTKYNRNFVRHEIIEKSKKINPELINAINSLSKIAKENNTIVDEYLGIIYKKIKNRYKYTTIEFLKISKALKNKVIYEIFKEYNLDYDYEKINRIRNFIETNSAKKSGTQISLNKDLFLYINNKNFYVIKKQENNFYTKQITKEGKYNTPFGIFEISKCETEQKIKKNDENYAYISIDKIDFTLRTRANGDIIHPLGMNGKQKLKKYLNEKKVPQHEKDRIILLADSNEVLWVAGYGVSEKIKACDKITHIIKFTKGE